MEDKKKETAKKSYFYFGYIELNTYICHITVQRETAKQTKENQIPSSWNHPTRKSYRP